MLIKNIAWLVALTMLPVTGSLAQGDVHGIYRTVADYRNNVLTQPHVTDAGHYLQPHRTRLTVYENGVAKRYAFGSVYGYYRQGHAYRAYGSRKPFSQNGYYKIENNAAFMVYSGKSTHQRANGYTWYYYSVGDTGTIKALKKRNLEKDFANHPEFVRRALEALKQTDTARWRTLATAYDTLVTR